MIKNILATRSSYSLDFHSHLLFETLLECLDRDLSFALDGGQLLSLRFERPLDILVDLLFGLQQLLHLVFHLFFSFIINSSLINFLNL